ncbi:MAG: hypothetical protein IJ593_11010 [Lachnospiraceae bacterium]|nr:hypothetical protein [Lachnospiraceae bacterium]
MVKIIIVFVIAIVLLVIAFRMKADHKSENLQLSNFKETYATIDRVIFSDTGNAKYYVSFYENGDTITAQTDHYSSETKSLNTGDEVKIRYFVTKNGAPRAVIIDDRLIPVSNSVSDFYKILMIAGILLILVSAAMLVKVMFT